MLRKCKSCLFCSKVILELNTTEVSHSASNVGMEVFAEPESTICLRGSLINDLSDTFSALSTALISAFPPADKSWFFQCGVAR